MKWDNENKKKLYKALAIHFTYSTCSCEVSKINMKRSVSLRMGCGTEVGNVTIPANHDIPKAGDVVEVRYKFKSEEE
jgi:bifunctional non-homologous end joining protein LigD